MGSPIMTGVAQNEIMVQLFWTGPFRFGPVDWPFWSNSFGPFQFGPVVSLGPFLSGPLGCSGKLMCFIH